MATRNLAPLLPPAFAREDDDYLPKPSFALKPIVSGSVDWERVLPNAFVLGLEEPRRVRRRVVKTLLLAVATSLLLALSGAGYLYWQARSLVGELQAGPKKEIVEEANIALGTDPKVGIEQQLERSRPASTPPLAPAPDLVAKVQTILLIGSDRRWGQGSGRSDTMMLVRIDEQQRTISTLSIPRDLRVPIPGYGSDKVNAAFSYGGPRLLIASLRDYFGVRIDHFIEINFRGFGDMVTALGGVYVPVDGRYWVPPNAGHMQIDLQAGYQQLRRADALSFVRFRHYDSDFYRAARQQVFLREAQRQVVASKLDYRKMSKLLRTFAHSTLSDLDSLSEIWVLATIAKSTPADRVTREVVPATGGLDGGVYYLDAATPERRAVIERWAHPERKVVVQEQTNTKLKAQPKRKPVDRSLVSDGGRGASLIGALPKQFARCAPTELPPGYAWGRDTPVRAYELAGQPALAAWFSAGSGRSVILMQTTWTEAPILDRPTRSLRRGNRSYDIWYESGVIRQIAWRMGSTAAWLTNTLRNELTPEQMLSLAASCAPLA